MNLKENIRRILNEDTRIRNVTIQIVRDIITVFNNNESGYFHLPEYFEERDVMTYEIPKINSEVVIELMIEEDTSIQGYGVNANFLNEEESIEVKIVYNPSDKQKILYNLSGELNEIMAHELRHLFQQVKGTHDLDVKPSKDSFKYYTSPHEIDAQYYGFKRLSKLTKKPFDEVVRNWFETHRDTHELTKGEEDKVINLILKHK
jgi:hypothetical protein